MARKWTRFTALDNPWSHIPADGWRSKHWEILFRPPKPGQDRELYIVSGLARARAADSTAHSYFLLYDNGQVGWDRPETVPKYVQEKAKQLANSMAPGTRGFEGFGRTPLEEGAVVDVWFPEYAKRLPVAVNQTTAPILSKLHYDPRGEVYTVGRLPDHRVLSRHVVLPPKRSMAGWGSFSGRKKVKMDECYSPGVLVHLYALMEASGSVGGGVLFSGWEREATVQGRNSPWIFFRVPYRPVPEPYNWHADQARLKAMADQARAMRDLLKQRDVPAVLWCGDWGPPRAPDAPPPKGTKAKPQKAFDRAVRELKRAIKDRAEDIVATLDDIEEEEKRLAEEEGWQEGYEEYPGFVGCLDPTTGVVYEAGIEWPQYFQGCGGPGPWNAIVSFYLDLEDPKDMLDAVEGAVSEAFDAAGVEDY